MNRKIILVIPLILALTGCPWDKKKVPAEPEKYTKKAHDSFVGTPPKPSKPYNIMDYTKSAPKQQ